MAWTKEDRSFKTLIDKQTSSSGKAFYEEFGDVVINVNAEQTWFDSLSSNPDTATAIGIAQYYNLLVLANDITVANNQSYFTSSNSADTSTNSSNRLKNWISDKYGSLYNVRLFDNNNNEIFTTDPSGWFFDYKTGILTFNGSTAGFSKPFKISGYRFIGRTVYDTITSLSSSLSSAGGSSTAGLSSVFVSLNLDQTIGGNKSFLNNIILSTSPSASNHLVTKGYVDTASSNLFSYTNSNTASLYSTITSASSNLNFQINTVSSNLFNYTNAVSSNINNLIVNLTGSYVTLNTTQSINGDKTFQNNVTINGNLFVSGTATTVSAQDLVVTDNLITLNFGESNSGVTRGFAGVLIDRGIATNYVFIFDEPTDSFRIGETGNTQSVATREDNPINNSFAYWSSISNRFETNSDFNIYTFSTSSAVNSISSYLFNYVNSNTASLYSTITSASSNLNSQINTVSSNLFSYTNTVSSNINSNLQNYVHLLTDQTIGGNKSFLNNIVLSASPSASNHVITKGYLDSVSSNFGSPTGGLSSVFVTLNTVQTISADKIFTSGVTASSLNVTNTINANIIEANAKSFVIDHPILSDKKLVHGSLEGPEFGVYVRGRAIGYKFTLIHLPDYWEKLVDSNTITVQLTSIGHKQDLIVKNVNNKILQIENKNWFNKEIDCFYTIYGERHDIPKLEIVR